MIDFDISFVGGASPKTHKLLPISHLVTTELQYKIGIITTYPAVSYEGHWAGAQFTWSNSKWRDPN